MASTSASITLQHLPDELLQLVIENMSAASKKRFSRVNRLMRNLAMPQLSKTLRLDASMSSVEEAAQHLSPAALQSFTTLDISLSYGQRKDQLRAPNAQLRHSQVLLEMVSQMRPKVVRMRIALPRASRKQPLCSDSEPSSEDEALHTPGTEDAVHHREQNDT